MKFRKSGEQETTIFIAPFIDMVLVLLIFFMATSHFNAASGVPIQLPGVSAKAPDDKREKVALVIDKTGQMYLRGAKLDTKSLEKELRVLIQEKGLISLVLQADRSVSHGTVVEAMDIAKVAGVSTIIIAADWRPRQAAEKRPSAALP